MHRQRSRSTTFALSPWCSRPRQKITLAPCRGATSPRFNPRLCCDSPSVELSSFEPRRRVVSANPGSFGKITLFDSTLRDGLLHPQLQHIPFNERLSIAEELLQTPVDVIEAGHCKRKWPSNHNLNNDERMLLELSQHFRNLYRSHTTMPPVLCALTDTDPHHIEAALLSLEEAPFYRINIYIRVSEEGKSVSPMSLDKLLKLQHDVTRAVSTAADSVDGNGGVQLTMADATRAHENTISVIAACAVAAGASTLVLADTAGIAEPSEIVSLVTAARKASQNCTIGIHAHDDKGKAITNSVAALMFAATHVEGTMLGIGPRAGNARLDSIATWLAHSPHHNFNNVFDVHSFRNAATRIKGLLHKDAGALKALEYPDFGTEHIVDELLRGETQSL